MFSFLKGQKKPSKDENAISADDVLIPEMKETGSDEEIETTLSIPNDWTMTDEERYVFSFHNSQSPKLKKNQISIYGMELTKESNKGVLVTGLIRSTVTQSIQFEQTKILLMSNEKAVARKDFDLGQLGALPTNSSRPWRFQFNKDDILDDIDDIGDDWSLAFELKQKHRLDLDDAWEKSLDEKSKATLERIVEEAPELKEDEVNFMGVKAALDDKGDLAVTILIRNGNNKNITLEQIPLGIRDASNEEVARGSFKTNDLTVKANTSKPWTFIFPKSMVKKEDLDFSKWQAYPIQNN